MLNIVRKAIKEYDMLKKEDTVIVALSGGADSVSLLCALSELGYNVRALHVNHMLRGEESERDEAFVRRLCEEKNVPLDVFRENIAALAKEKKQGLEECGREVRYARLAAAAEKYNAKIATAHTLSDNAETLLMRIARGCSPDSLSAIPPVRGNIIRPLIFASRSDIESYCAQKGFEFVTDSSNLSDDYARNRIRHITIPSLQTVNEGFLKSAGRLIRQAERDKDYFAGQVNAARSTAQLKDGMDAKALQTLHSAVLSRLLVDEYERKCGAALDSVHEEILEELIAKGAGSVQLPGGMCASVRHGVFRLEKVETDCGEWCVEMKDGTARLPKGRIAYISVESRDEYEKNHKFVKDLFQNAFDYDKITSNVFVRSRRAGDKLRLKGRNVTKELRRLMNERSVPPQKRNDVAVLSAGDDVIWAEGFGTDEKYLPDENSKNIGVIRIDTDG